MRERPNRGCIAGLTTAISLALICATAILATPEQPGAVSIAGRWEFTYAAATARAGGPGRAADPPASSERRFVLDLHIGPGNALLGTVAVAPGGRGTAPGGNPLRPVEIADGRIDGSRFSFSAWQFDGYRNRIRYEGTVNGDSLRLALTRETSAGPEKIETIATRMPY